MFNIDGHTNEESFELWPLLGSKTWIRDLDSALRWDHSKSTRSKGSVYQENSLLEANANLENKQTVFIFFLCEIEAQRTHNFGSRQIRRSEMHPKESAQQFDIINMESNPCNRLKQDFVSPLAGLCESPS